MSQSSSTFNLARDTAAVSARVAQLDGELLLAIPCEPIGAGSLGVAIWRHTPDDSYITHIYRTDQEKAVLEHGDYARPGALDAYGAIARGCARAARLTGN